MKKFRILECILIILVLSLMIFFFLLPIFGTLISSIPRIPDFLENKFHVSALLRTLKFGFIVTLLSIPISYPISIFITSIKKFKALFISLVLFPLMTNTVVRTFGWIVILGKDGILNHVLGLIGISPIKFLYTDIAVIIGLLYLFIPLMVISLIGSMENIGKELEEAARNLGATPLRVFFDITFPLSLKGMITGSLLVFVGSVTSYITPKLLGGPRLHTLSTVLYQEAMVTMRWNEAITTAFVITLITLVFLLIMVKSSKVVRR